MQRKTVTFSRSIHREHPVLLIGFGYNEELKEYVKQFEGVRWSATLKHFYLPYDAQAVHHLFHYLTQKKYYVDYSALKAKNAASLPSAAPKRPDLQPLLGPGTKEKLGEFKKWMAQKRYSANTMKTYENMLVVFFRFHYPKGLEELGERDILSFNTDYIMAHGFSYTYQNQAINALKLFLRLMGGQALLPDALERPKKSKKLPEVFSIEEVKAILGHTPNLKHRTLLSLLYSCGLRIGEALHLQLRDIDFERKFMHIKAAKGAKDRYVPVPGQMIKLLKQYQTSYQPKGHLFTGQHTGPYTAVSARQVLKRSMQRAKIKKRATLHTLRHSHATHLLEKGTDLRFIQELLGHNSPKTTMIYTHVSTSSLDKIKNPFDEFEL